MYVQFLGETLCFSKKKNWVVLLWRQRRPALRFAYLDESVWRRGFSSRRYVSVVRFSRFYCCFSFSRQNVNVITAFKRYSHYSIFLLLRHYHYFHRRRCRHRHRICVSSCLSIVNFRTIMKTISHCPNILTKHNILWLVSKVGHQQSEIYNNLFRLTPDQPRNICFESSNFLQHPFFSPHHLPLKIQNSSSYGNSGAGQQESVTQMQRLRLRKLHLERRDRWRAENAPKVLAVLPLTSHLAL